MESSSVTDWPAVTVVIPAYNLAAYLDQTLESVLRQTYAGPVSIVVLDDGSRDDTLNVARAKASCHAQIQVHTQPNGGRVVARNRLLQLAATEIVGWLDGDDMACPDWLHDQVQLLLSNPSIAAVSGQGYSMTADNYPIGPIGHHPLTHAEIHQQHLSGKSNVFFQSCVVVRKSIVVAAGAYRPDYPAAEDFDLWIRLGEIGELHNIDKCHLIYRVHGTSANATQSVEQRTQGRQCANEARRRLGLPELPGTSDEAIPPPRKDRWNRVVYMTNIALKAGNPRTALKLVWPALREFPESALVWCMGLVAVIDCLLLTGNRTSRFIIGRPWLFGTLPTVSMYRWMRRIYGWLKRRQ